MKKYWKTLGGIILFDEMKRYWKILGGIVLFFVVSIVLAILFPDKALIEEEQKKPGMILLIDGIDLSKDKVGEENIRRWVTKNKKKLLAEYDVRVTITVYGNYVKDFDEAVYIQKWVESELKKENLAQAVLPTLEFGLLAVENYFKNKNIFPESRQKKYLIFLVRHLPSDLEDLELDLSGIKVIVVPVVPIEKIKNTRQALRACLFKLSSSRDIQDRGSFK